MNTSYSYTKTNIDVYNVSDSTQLNNAMILLGIDDVIEMYA